MILEQEVLEKLLYVIPDPYGLTDVLAQQELDRLAAIFYPIFSEHEPEPQADFQAWLKVVKPQIVKELNESQSFFGLMDIDKKLSLDEYLKRVFELSNGNLSSLQS